MSQRKRIGIDFDDVLMEFNMFFCLYNNMLYGTNKTKQDITTYDLGKVWNCSQEEAMRRVMNFFQSSYHANAQPLPYSREVVARLVKHHDLVIITSRPEGVRAETVAWLETHFKGLFSEVCFTGSFTNQPGIKKTKAEACKELNIDMCIEDAPEHALNMAGQGIPVLMIDAPWNTDVSGPNITRVSGWMEIEQVLQLV